MEAARQLAISIKADAGLLDLFDGFGHPEGGYRSDFSGGYNCYCTTGSFPMESTIDGGADLDAGEFMNSGNTLDIAGDTDLISTPKA